MISAQWLYLIIGLGFVAVVVSSTYALQTIGPVAAVALVAVCLAAGAGLGCWVGHREDQLRALSATDGLTGLFNRRHFETCLEQELARTVRHGSPLAVVLLDLDSLKSINDLLGHHAGDEAICSVAGALRLTCRNTDLVARWGGDEFVVLAPHTDAEQAALFVQRLATAVRTHSAANHREAQLRGRPSAPWVTVSLGFAIAQRDRPETLRPTALLAAADRTMYRAKVADRRSNQQSQTVRAVTK